MRAGLFRRSLAAPGAARQELPGTGVFRLLQTVRRFGQWGHTVLSGIGQAVGQYAKQLAGGSTPVTDPGEFRSSANYYQGLIDRLELPDRPPLARVERALPGEATAILRVSRIAASAVISAYCDLRKIDLAAKAMRDQHAKAHACLRATFVVSGSLPAGFDLGVFHPNRSYEAIVRFSNAMGSPQSDRKPDGRGMAIKLLDVSGRSILSTLVPGPPDGPQDFLMTNHPVFFCKDVADYFAFMDVMTLPHDSLIARGRAAARFVMFFVPWRLPQLWIFLAHSLKRIDSPLRTAYHSMTPYQLGDDKVVRYLATPMRTPRQAFPVSAEGPRENFLRDSLRAELDPTQHDPTEKAVFDIAVQVRHAPTADDVEDASRRWTKRQDQIVSMGRLEIPLQTFDGPDQLCACEDLSFNPWNALPEHRPLGGLNRMRLAVYLASRQVRRRLNLVPATPG
jgi:hypothetical protein